MKRIIITVGKTGQASVDAEGFQDAGCKAATKPFEDALSGGQVESKDKPEASIPASSGNATLSSY